MTNPAIPAQGPPAPGEQRVGPGSPAERVAAGMLNIASMIEGTFVTAQQRAAFMVSAEVQLDENGHLAFGRSDDPAVQRQRHIIRYMELKTDETGVEANVRVHRPPTVVDEEYNLNLHGEALPVVQRGGSEPQTGLPDREEDAEYIAWVEVSLASELARLQQAFGIGSPEEDAELPVNQYADPTRPVSPHNENLPADPGAGWVNH